MSDRTRPNILLLSAQVPFSRGGAESLIERLCHELTVRGYCADVVALPFSAAPAEQLLSQIALWRGLELSAFAGRTVDMVIATKFPTYLACHPCKISWLIHQHRQAYDLYGSRFGDFQPRPEDEAIVRAVRQADQTALRECRARFTISQNVSDRLERYLGLDSRPLLPPLPLAGRYYSAEPEGYILSVGRLCSIKRVDLLLRALPLIDSTLKVKIVGAPDEPGIERYLHSEIEKHHLWHRVELLGRVDDETLLKLYASAFAVYYAPFDEDYGFVTLEALASGRPVVTASDSGTPLEFVQHEQNGLIAAPNEESIAESFNRLRNDAQLYRSLRNKPPATSTWDMIIDELTAEALR